MIHLFITLGLYIVYLYRYTLFLYYCTLCNYFDVYNNTATLHLAIEHSCISFNYITFCISEESNNKYTNKTIDCTDKLVLMKKNNSCMIYPNTCFVLAPNPFIICEVVLGDTHFDITEHLKLFYVKDNTILNRPFITYIFYTFFRIHISMNDNYYIKYIDTNANIKIIDTDINIYKYTI
jgi:hypothetical protein